MTTAAIFAPAAAVLSAFPNGGYTVYTYSYLVIRMSLQLLSGAFLPAAPDAPPFSRPLISHKVSAGFPSPAADYVETALDLNAYLVEHKEATFFFKVAGDSMIGVGIMDGDVVVVDRAVNPASGHVVLAVIDGEYTIKTLRMSRYGSYELHPENPAYKPIRLAEGQELQVWGVVTGSVRKLRPR